jgi:hypothetical protein
MKLRTDNAATARKLTVSLLIVATLAMPGKWNLGSAALSFWIRRALTVMRDPEYDKVDAGCTPNMWPLRMAGCPSSYWGTGGHDADRRKPVSFLPKLFQSTNRPNEGLIWRADRWGVQLPPYGHCRFDSPRDNWSFYALVKEVEAATDRPKLRGPYRKQIAS